MKIKSNISALLLVLVALISFSYVKYEVKPSNNHVFFDGYTFTLDHILLNGVETSVSLEHAWDPGVFYDAPTIEFDFNSTDGNLDVMGGLFCNAFSGKYIDNATNFSVTSIGITLMECSTPTNYYSTIETTVAGGITPTNISYEIASDESGFWMWIDENEKLFYSREVLNVDRYLLEKSITLYPNPVKDVFEIKSDHIQIISVSVFDLVGKEVLKTTISNSEVNLSALNSGVYICKITTEKGTIFKKILKE